MLDSWRLALGTLTALPVAAPSRVDRAVAGRAALLAPLAAVPLGLSVAAALWVGSYANVPATALGLLAVAVLVLGTRALHVDGLADTADGLTASYDRERSLAVMRTGDVGPAGVAAVVIVLGLQSVGFAALADAPLIAGALVCLSRGVVPLCCMHGVPAARPDGLGSPFAASVPREIALLAWIATASVGIALAVVLDASWLRAISAFAIATVVVALLVRRAIRRLGGITGDVFGAAIELSLAVLVVVAAS
ncbi:MAG TPA: adenosylcobinamide-GDP ribazoletransferase [Aeromicrobium sp.]|nr:adenosylcobinamide-GDP ribazoletransferase [Aeromicrobium sp.]